MDKDQRDQRDEQTVDSQQPANQQEEEAAPPTKPVILVRVVRDNLEVELEIQRTGTNTSDPLLEDLMEALAEKGVAFGIETQVLQTLCRRPTYNNAFVVARGKAPKVGADGFLKYLVHTTRELRPKINPDGTADFKDLGFIQNVLKDQPLCEIHAPQKGADGRNVLDEVLEGIFGKEPPSPMGANTVISEDGTMLLAAVDGNVEVKNGVISIVEVLKIAGNIDNSTGDIKFTGDVIISGDVVSGFKVQSGGSIQVRGSVEGATLEAAMDISIGESMNGMSRGVLSAGRNVKCKYIQSCYVKAQGDIFADTLMYCTVECGGNVELSGKRGALIGGRASIAGKLIAKTIGTSTHTATEVNMCAADPVKTKQIADMVENIKRLDMEIQKLMQVLARYEDIAKKVKLTPEQIAAIKTVKDSYVLYSQQRKDSAVSLGEMQSEQLEASLAKSYAECKDRIHTGVRFTFGPISMMVTESFVYSRIFASEGQVMTAPL